MPEGSSLHRSGLDAPHATSDCRRQAERGGRRAARPRTQGTRLALLDDTVSFSVSRGILRPRGGRGHAWTVVDVDTEHIEDGCMAKTAAEKLGIKPEHTIYPVNPPGDYVALIGGLPPGAAVVGEKALPADVVHLEQASHHPEITGITSIPRAYSETEGNAWLDRQHAQQEQRTGISLAIADTRTGQALGYVGVNGLVWRHLRGRSATGWRRQPQLATRPGTQRLPARRRPARLLRGGSTDLGEAEGHPFPGARCGQV